MYVHCLGQLVAQDNPNITKLKLEGAIQLRVNVMEERLRKERRSSDRRTWHNAPRHRESFGRANQKGRDFVASGGLETAPPRDTGLNCTRNLMKSE